MCLGPEAEKRRSSALLSSAFASSVQQTERIVLPGKPGEMDEIFHITRGKIPADLKPLLSQPFTPEETERIYSQVGLNHAERLAEPARPKALWIFGPPAAGKSTLAAQVATKQFGQAGNAVSVDGNEIRDAHEGFRRVAEHGFAHHVLHKDAWDTLKETSCVERLKKSILKQAIGNRQNIVLPDCALKPERVKEMLKALQEADYEMHAICLWTPQDEAERRGRLRSVKTGKAYNGKFHHSSCEGTLEVAAFWEAQTSPSHFGGLDFYDTSATPGRKVSKDHFEMLIYSAEADRRKSLARPEGRRLSVSATDKPKEMAVVLKGETSLGRQVTGLLRRFQHWAQTTCPSFQSLKDGSHIVCKSIQGFIPAGVLGLFVLAALHKQTKQ